MKSRHTLKVGFLDKSYVLSEVHENLPDHCSGPVIWKLCQNHFLKLCPKVNLRDISKNIESGLSR